MVVPAGFWGAEFLPNKIYSQEVDDPYRITMAALGADAEKGARSTLYVRMEDKELAICTLEAGRVDQQSLDQYFALGEEVAFVVRGDVKIHVTGYEVIEDVSEFDNFEDELSGEDEEIPSDIEGSEEEELTPEELAELENLTPEELAELEKLTPEELAELEKLAAEGELESDEEMEGEEVDSEEEDSEEEPSEAEIEAAIQQANKRKETAPETQPIKKAKAEDKAIPVVKTEEAPLSKRQQKKLKKEAAAAAAASKENQPEVKQEEKKQQNEQKPKESPQTDDKKKTLPNGLVIEDVLVGNGPVAKSGKKVAVRYIGKLKNGKTFDSNTKGSPFVFKLGAGEVIKGWDLGVAGMAVGGTRKLTIPASLAYGARGAPPSIPGNATLTFEVKLLEVKK